MRLYFYLMCFSFCMYVFSVCRVHAAPTQAIREWRSHLEQVINDIQPAYGCWESGSQTQVLCKSSWCSSLPIYLSSSSLGLEDTCFLCQAGFRTYMFQFFPPFPYALWSKVYSLFKNAQAHNLNTLAEWTLIRIKYKNVGDIEFVNWIFLYFYFHIEYFI